MENEEVCYKILYNKDGEAIRVEDLEGNEIKGTEPPKPFHVESIVDIISDPILITLDADQNRHCWRRIGRRLVCVSC